jgi:hypothetical protein
LIPAISATSSLRFVTPTVESSTVPHKNLFLSLDFAESRLARQLLQCSPEFVEEQTMIANQPYDPMSLMRFQLSLLSLGAELDQSAPIAAKEVSTGALFEAEQLKNRIDLG